MEKEKFRLSVIDSIPDYKRHTSGWFDDGNQELFLGDTVDRDGRKYLIGYRYGAFCLLPFMASCYITPQDGSGMKLLNEVTAIPDQYLAIGYTDEPMYEKLNHLK